MNLETLKPGPEMDAVVAELVMSWPVVEGRTRRSGVSAPCWTTFGDDTPGYIPSFSTTIPSAWIVVEKMKTLWNQQGDDEPLVWDFKDCADHGWRADIFWLHHDGDIDAGGAGGATLPEAICRAALTWMAERNRFDEPATT